MEIIVITTDNGTIGITIQRNYCTYLKMYYLSCLFLSQAVSGNPHPTPGARCNKLQRHTPSAAAWTSSPRETYTNRANDFDWRVGCLGIYLAGGCGVWDFDGRVGCLEFANFERLGLTFKTDPFQS